jgi:predicted dienelactone hydrolase
VPGSVRKVADRGALLALLLLLGRGGWSAPSVARAADAFSITLPKPSGPYPVGRRSFYVLDSSRSDPQAVRPDGKREFMLIVWYPAAARAGTGRAPWIPGPWADSAATDLFLLTRSAIAPPTRAEVRETARVTASWAQDSADVASDGVPFPVVVFSPGNLTMPNYYTTLAEELASWGLVVVGHVTTGYSRNVVLPDGRVFPRRPYRDLDPWTGDLRYVLGHLSEWNRDPRHPFHDRLDTLRIGLYGHSGGANAVEMLAADGRVKAVAAIDPGLTDTTWATSKPTLLLLAENKQFLAAHAAEANDVSRERAAFLRRLPRGFAVTILGSEHMSFSDLSAIPAFRSEFESPEQLAASGAILLGFFQEALRGVPWDPRRGAANTNPIIRIDSSH